MQNLFLVFLLAITASTVFAFDSAVFAQESMAGEEMAGEEMAGEEMAGEEMAGEEMQVTMMDGNAESTHSPLQQLFEGTDPHEIQCGEGLQLVFKASNFHPACVKESTYQVLLQRGWASSHDPSHEELAAMVESLPIPQETEEAETEETNDTEMNENTEIEIEEEVNIEEEPATENGTEPTPQDYTIDLSESMDMAAN